MKKITFATAAILATFALGAPVAHADSVVADESASICNSLSLVDAGYTDWGNIQISLLQLSYDMSRSSAVATIRSAASKYCPEYASAVPVK